MITKEDSLVLRLRSTPHDVVQSAIKRWSLSEIKKSKSLVAAMIDDGWEPVDVAKDAHAVDGRPVYRVRGSAYAMRADVFAQRVRDAIDDAQTKAAQRTSRHNDAATDEHAVAECIAAITCPQMIEGKPCGGSLNRKGAPSCVTGRMGYKYRYTCESCGCDIVTREELR